MSARPPRPPASPRLLRADRGDHRRRLDRVLVRHLADLPASRNQVHAWIAAGRVLRNAKPAERPAERVEHGDAIEVDLPPPPPEAPALPPPPPEEMPLAVVWEDEHLVAVDKPAGLAVHPTARRRGGTLLNALLASPRGWEDGKPRLVQRLDKGTSGVMLVAKSARAHKELARALAAPDAFKEYLAVVYGVPEQAKGRIELGILRHPEEPWRMAASARQGRASATRTEVLAVTRGEGVRLALLACRLETGRTHQIRVHLAARGLPLVGDRLYGEPRWKGVAEPALAAACRAFPRQALHARRLAFTHPWTRRPLELTAPLPPDLAGLLETAGLEVGKESGG